MDTKEFIWTDELVKEYIQMAFAPCDPNHQFQEKRMKDFKKSKQPILDYEIIEFRSINNEDNPMNRWVLNNENKYKCHPGAVAFSLEEMLHKNRCVDTGDIKIHSVKRLSDNEVFTIGDKIDFKGQAFEISKFELNRPSCQNTIAVWAYDKVFHLGYINKVSKQPLFTTEDNVDVYEDYEGEIFRVFISNSSFESWRVYNLGMPQFYNKDEKYFVSKEAANKYIIENKPCLSFNDILSISDATFDFLKLHAKRLRELVKSKLK